ncbi:hypothetical protein SAMN05192583_0868 [Sphingomonas gellani]|uniref:Uncharacterized protein n=1 Tax=Sphingomonas gellani TaxID=1166340 RepID=A0A1H7ZXV0_9SPHN|nr:hypothetical protein [Sphingomonas gellani]SEM62319.1 hypothetical protein SAMN05192583_0868 [Sphingomonas gellani]
MEAGRRVDALGIAWYKRADYSRILEVMEDSDKLPITFDRWQSQAEGLETGFKKRGVPTFRAHIDPEHFVAWCADRGLNVDAEARQRWGSELAHQRLTGGQH